jgi:type I restriction enzyme, S subunit
VQKVQPVKRQAPQETDDLKEEQAFSVADLPAGWAVAQLGEVAYARLGKTPKKSDYRDKGTHRIIKFRDLTASGTNYSKTKAGYVVDQSDALNGLRPLSKGDVLVTASAHSGEQIGRKCAYVGSLPDADGGVYFVGELLGITSNPTTMDSKWPYLWFLSEHGVRSVQAAVAGVHLTAGRAQKIPIPLAPLAEQKRIVAKVEELLARLNATRERLVKVPAILKHFRQAVLAAACSGRLTEDWRAQRISETTPSQIPMVSNGDFPEIPQGWLWLAIDKLSSPSPRSIQSGPFGSNLLHSEFQDTGVLAIGIDNVMVGKFSKGRQHRISQKKYRELEKYRARPLDVLITVMATVGRCCVVPEDLETAIITKHVYRITPDRKIVNPHYLMYSLLGDPTVQSQIQGQIRGQTRPGINGKILKAVSIATPPISEQDEIVRRVDALLELADKIDRRVTVARRKGGEVTQAILAKAFRGELVATEAELASREGRSYETASELLARINSVRISPNQDSFGKCARSLG